MYILKNRNDPPLPSLTADGHPGQPLLVAAEVGLPRDRRGALSQGLFCGQIVKLALRKIEIGLAQSLKFIV